MSESRMPELLYCSIFTSVSFSSYLLRLFPLFFLLSFLAGFWLIFSFFWPCLPFSVLFLAFAYYSYFQFDNKSEDSISAYLANYGNFVWIFLFKSSRASKQFWNWSPTVAGLAISSCMKLYAISQIAGDIVLFHSISISFSISFISFLTSSRQ